MAFPIRIVSYGVKPADQFTAHPKNARIHPQFQRDVMKAALETVGFVAPVLESLHSGYVLDGHERIWAGLQKDNADVPYVVVDVTEDEEAYVLATFDPITSLASYEQQKLDDLLRDVQSDDAAIQQMLSDLANEHGLYLDDEPTPDPGAQIDKAEELQQKWQVARGDVWEIGVHRLLCGDSTRAADVARVMDNNQIELFISDPPYGVSYADKNKFLNAISRGNRIQTPIKNDHQTVSDMADLWLKVFTIIYKNASPGCPYYLTGPQGGELMMMMMMMIEKSGWLLKHMLIWVKNNHVLGRADYNYKHEPILYGWKDGGHKFYANGSEVSVWEVNKPQVNDLHPTTKPIELFERAIKNSSIAEQLICDPFLGSGTTLVACEQTGRRGRGIEIEPKYCAVTLERLHQMGLEPKRVE